jgi:ribonucleotide reductase alpha subunit
MKSLFQAQQLNKDIFETVYYHALKASAELAAKEGPCETYEGSPVSKPVSKVCFNSFFLIKLLILSNVCGLIFLLHFYIYISSNSVALNLSN